jgi:hypothetical protein
MAVTGGNALGLGLSHKTGRNAILAGIIISVLGLLVAYHQRISPLQGAGPSELLMDSGSRVAMGTIGGGDGGMHLSNMCTKLPSWHICF